SRRARPLRSLGEALRRADRKRTSPRHGGMEPGSGSGIGKAAAGGGTPPLAGNPATPLSLLLSDEQISRRDQELVQRADPRAPSDDARPRHDRPPLRRARDANHFWLHRL